MPNTLINAFQPISLSLTTTIGYCWRTGNLGLDNFSNGAYILRPSYRVIVVYSNTRSQIRQRVNHVIILQNLMGFTRVQLVTLFQQKISFQER
jgi:hypothetical protein